MDLKLQFKPSAHMSDVELLVLFLAVYLFHYVTLAACLLYAATLAVRVSNPGCLCFSGILLIVRWRGCRQTYLVKFQDFGVCEYCLFNVFLVAL